MNHYTAQFEQAVRLADHVDGLLARREAKQSSLELQAATDFGALESLQNQRVQSDLYRSWTSLAARDAAMTLKHFQYLLGQIIADARIIPTINGLLAPLQLEASEQLFLKHFPDFREIRNAVAHAAERASSRKEADKYSFSGFYEGPGVKLDGPQNITLTIQSGRMLQMTWKGKVVSVSVTEESLQKLEEVKQAVYNAFEPVAAALKGKDLGD